MRLQPGSLLGPYEILAPLGAGGMGEVYRARDRRLAREVAVKVLADHGPVHPERLQRLEQEARATGALNHPNILAIHDIGTSNGSTYVVSELLDGESLRGRLAGDALPLRKAIDYGVQIASGLAAAHDKGIVHRDVKPENLFITRDGRIKILDFGLAKLFAPAPGGDSSTGPSAPEAPETDPGRVLGTVGYMSPEQVRALPVDHRSDIFSLGTVLYEMLSGRRAFRKDTAAETMTAILKEDPPELSEAGRPLPPAMDRLVRRCLEKRPEERFQSARDVAFALEALSGLSASGVQAAVAAAGAPRRRALVAATAAAALLLAGVVIGKVLWRTPGSGPPSFTQLTFRRGWISSARFASDGQTVVYSAAWEGQPVETFTARPGSPEWRSLGITKARLLSVSKSGEIAMLLGGGAGLLSSRAGTLAQMPLAGGAPREVLEAIEDADWAPDGKTLAIVRSAQGRNRLELPVGKVLYETAGGIGYPRVSPDGQTVAFLDWPVLGDDRGSVALVDREGRMKRLTREQNGTQGLAWTADGRELWFTAGQEELNRALRAVSLSGRERLLARVPGVLKLQDIGPGGRALLIHDNQHFGIMGLPPGETKERDLSWFETSWAGDLSSDGRTLLFSESELKGSLYAAYLRRTDGSPAVRLGEGGAQALSPDGRFALAVMFAQSELMLLPTGPGERRTLPRGPIQNYVGRGTFFPDGRHVLVAAHEAGHGVRLYVQDLEGGLPRPITPEGVILPWAARPISPDARVVAALGPNREPWLYPLGEGQPSRLSGLASGDWPITWSPDGKMLYVGRLGEQGAEIHRYDLASGRKEPWRQLALPDPAGVRHLGTVMVTPDGKSHAYGYVRTLSHLYVVDGLE